MQDGLPLGLAQIQRHALFIGVQVQKQTALFGMRGIAGKGTTLAGNVTARRFDFDHIRAKVGQQLAGIGGRNHIAALNDGNPGQELFSHNSPPSLFLRLNLGLFR